MSAIDMGERLTPHAAVAELALPARIARGEIVRPERCEVVGCDRPARHAHHENYDRPLRVAHLCPLHHELLHHDESALPIIREGTLRWTRPPKTQPPTVH